MNLLEKYRITDISLNKLLFYYPHNTKIEVVNTRGNSTGKIYVVGKKHKVPLLELQTYGKTKEEVEELIHKLCKEVIHEKTLPIIYYIYESLWEEESHMSFLISTEKSTSKKETKYREFLATRLLPKFDSLSIAAALNEYFSDNGMFEVALGYAKSDGTSIKPLPESP